MDYQLKQVVYSKQGSTAKRYTMSCRDKDCHQPIRKRLTDVERRDEPGALGNAQPAAAGQTARGADPDELPPSLEELTGRPTPERWSIPRRTQVPPTPHELLRRTQQTLAEIGEPTLFRMLHFAFQSPLDPMRVFLLFFYFIILFFYFLLFFLQMTM